MSLANKLKMQRDEWSMELMSAWKKQKLLDRRERLIDLAMYAGIIALFCLSLWALHENAMLHQYLRLATSKTH